ncbi:Phosphoglucomutase/phosphomannomutase [Candidatus Lokiarchaeum ossiferum]|uniref:Phosphoglucomutase/phosphomannomutase n=1 Tax=Candidatus Lokiarchaeum ossiferum TaxID=2951803 RepID=A0ABY6HW59_9ARCH|nr:Phosphoglucomutase/phosphomannomutase [Candidatus Lokiarchaeum sp. B-35]
MTEILDLSEIMERGRIQATGNEVLTPEAAAKIGAALGSYLGPKGILVVAREYSNNNRMLKRAFIGGVMSAGIDILNLHSAPAPVLQFCIRRFGASAGVYFSSVSSGKLQNQIRFYDSSGIEFNRASIDSVNEYFKNNKIYRAKPLEVGAISDIPHTQDIYKKALPQFVNRKLMKQKNLHIVVDCSYGPGAIVIPSILTDLKNDVIAINAYQNDQKATEMFPNLRSIKDVINIVKAINADLGVVLDTDGSRALYIDETGRILSYEELMMFFLKYEEKISKLKGSPIIATESSSKILDQFAIENCGFTMIKTQNFPGEISRGLREERAAFGGADTMKYYFPQYGPFSDATFTTLKIIEILARENLPLSALIRAFPRTIHAYKTVPLTEEKLNRFKEQLRKLLRTTEIEGMDYQDIMIGTKIVLKEKGWVTITPSVHANAIELEAEGNDPEKSEDLIRYAEDLIQPIL